MTVMDVLAMRQQLEAFMQTNTAMVLFANPVYGRCETHYPIAAFDTIELMFEYLKAAALPLVEDIERYRTTDGVVRSWRPDSLLWDYNGGSDFLRMGESLFLHSELMVPWNRYTSPEFTFGGPEIPYNPTPPSGPVPHFQTVTDPYNYEDSPPSP